MHRTKKKDVLWDNNEENSFNDCMISLFCCCRNISSEIPCQMIDEWNKVAHHTMIEAPESDWILTAWKWISICFLI